MAKKKVKKQDWEIIDTPYGQWEYPGAITRIPSNDITMQGVPYPVLGVSDTNDIQMMYPNQDYQFDGSSVTEYPMMQTGGRPPLKILDPREFKIREQAYNDSLNLFLSSEKQKEALRSSGYSPLGNTPWSGGIASHPTIKPIQEEAWGKNGITSTWIDVYKKPVQPVVYEPRPIQTPIQLDRKEGLLESNSINLGDINPIPFEQGSYFTRERKPQEADRGKMEYFDKKTGRSIGLYDEGGELPEAGSGYKVVRSSERKGKTHKVTGPDGTVKFFGDSKLGQHPKDPARKKAFYARHKKNLAGNPYFRAFARKTWEEGGMLPDLAAMAFGGNLILEKYQDGGSNWEILPKAQVGTQMGIISDPRKDVYYTQPANSNAAIQQRLEAKAIMDQRTKEVDPRTLPVENKQSIVQANPQGAASKAWEIVSHPMTAITNLNKYGRIPDYFSSGSTNPFEYAVDVVNPAFYANAAGRTLKNIVNPQTYTDIPKAIGSAVINLTGEDAYPEWNDAALRTLGRTGDALILLPVAGMSFRKGAKQLPGSGNVDFSKYPSQLEAVQARAERLLSQKNKKGWNEQLTPELEERLSTAVQRHDVAGDYPGTSLGTNRSGRTETLVSKDANIKGVPLTESQKSMIAAHETGHYYSNSLKEGIDWQKYFDFSDLPYKTTKYLKGKSNYQNFGNEIRERAAQLKDYIAYKNNIPLNKDFKITRTQLDDALENYVKITGLDNSMTPFVEALKKKGDISGFLKEMNKRPLALAPAAIIGAGAATQTKNEPYRNGGKIKPKSSNWEILPEAGDGTSVIDLHLPKYPDRRTQNLYATPYMFGLSPAKDVNVYGAGASFGVNFLDRGRNTFGATGNVNNTAVSYPGGFEISPDPYRSLGLRYVHRFQKGGTIPKAADGVITLPPQQMYTSSINDSNQGIISEIKTRTDVKKIQEEKEKEKAISDSKDKKIRSREYNKLDVQSKYLESLNKQENEQKKKTLNDVIFEYENADKNKIKDFQKILISEGYDLGKYGADGKFGEFTKNAIVSKFQNDSLDKSLIDKYYKNFDDQNVKNVKQIQEKLFNDGYLKGNPLEEIDGKFGDKTKQALEKYNKVKDPNAFFFTNIPKKVEEEECAKGMCKVLELNDVMTDALGVKYKNAWDIFENMNSKKNSTSVYNIYDDSRFKNIRNKEELVNLTKAVKQESQTSPDMYKSGDIVGIFWPGSEHHEETLKSKTHNTHVGFVSSVENGVPMITHNVFGNVKTEPFNKLNTTWIQRPKQNVKFNEKYNPEFKTRDNTKIIENYEKRFNAKITPERKKQLSSILNIAYSDSQNLPKLLNSDVDPEWLESAVVGITGVETGIGKEVSRNREDKDLKNKTAYALKGIKDEDISLGISKTKFNTLDNFSKSYFDIKDVNDLGNDEKLLHATTYNIIKYYDTFKDYANKFPELQLTEQDVKDMAILAHNRGDKKLLSLGRRSDNPNDKTYYEDSKGLNFEEEVKKLRDITRRGAMQNDKSSTLWRYAPNSITDPMDFTSETYVSKVKNYQKDLYNRSFKNGGKVKLKPKSSNWEIVSNNEWEIIK